MKFSDVINKSKHVLDSPVGKILSGTTSPILELGAQAAAKGAKFAAKALSRISDELENHKHEEYNDDEENTDAGRSDNIDDILTQLQNDDFDNDAYQEAIDEQELYDGTEDHFLYEWFRYLGWKKLRDTLDSQSMEEMTDEQLEKNLDLYESATGKCIECLKGAITDIPENLKPEWAATLYLAMAKEIWSSSNVDSTRYAILALPYAEDESEEKGEAEKWILGEEEHGEAVGCTGGYGLMYGITWEECLQIEADRDSYKIDKSIPFNRQEFEDCGKAWMKNIESLKKWRDNRLFSFCDYDDRQVIFIVKNLEHIKWTYDSTNTIKYVFILSKLPKDISFPEGRPHAEGLYYAHPLRPEYLPFENALMTLLKEKTKEVCRLFQCLGARSIAIKCLQGAGVTDNILYGETEKGTKVTEKACISKVVISPEKFPYVPDDLLWTVHDEELKKLINLRRNGFTGTFTLKISSYETANLTAQRVAEIKQGLLSMLDANKRLAKTSSFNVFRNTEETIWEISADFSWIEDRCRLHPKQYSDDSLITQIDNFVYNIYMGIIALGTLTQNIESGQQVVLDIDGKKVESEIDALVLDGKYVGEANAGDRAGLIIPVITLTNMQAGIKIYLPEKASDTRQTSILVDHTQSISSDNQPSALTPEEEKYREEVLFCLEDIGAISPEDRKYLDRKRERFGLSQKRASEIEAICSTPKLTETEKEYIETYKELSAGGELSARARRLLDRERDSLGISPERATELEKSL